MSRGIGCELERNELVEELGRLVEELPNRSKPKGDRLDLLNSAEGYRKRKLAWSRCREEELEQSFGSNGSK